MLSQNRSCLHRQNPPPCLALEVKHYMRCNRGNAAASKDKVTTHGKYVPVTVGLSYMVIFSIHFH